MSRIKITYQTKDYILEFNRQSVKALENQGFSLEQISNKPMTMIPMLFVGAFRKNQPTMKTKIADEIYDHIDNKTGLIEALAEMYAETLSTLTEQKEDVEGNANWEITQ